MTSVTTNVNVHLREKVVKGLTPTRTNIRLKRLGFVLEMKTRC